MRIILTLYMACDSRSVVLGCCWLVVVGDGRWFSHVLMLVGLSSLVGCLLVVGWLLQVVLFLALLLLFSLSLLSLGLLILVGCLSVLLLVRVCRRVCRVLLKGDGVRSFVASCLSDSIRLYVSGPCRSRGGLYTALFSGVGRSLYGFMSLGRVSVCCSVSGGCARLGRRLDHFCCSCSFSSCRCACVCRLAGRCVCRCWRAGVCPAWSSRSSVVVPICLPCLGRVLVVRFVSL